VEPDDIERQAEALREYVRRGGLAERWLRSKDFAPEDRRAILAAYRREREQAAS